MDIALVQEPYTCRSRMLGLDANPIGVALSNGEHLPGSRQLVHGAAIVIFNSRLIVHSRADLICVSSQLTLATLDVSTSFLHTSASVTLLRSTWTSCLPCSGLWTALRSLLRILTPCRSAGTTEELTPMAHWSRPSCSLMDYEITIYRREHSHSVYPVVTQTLMSRSLGAWVIDCRIGPLMNPRLSAITR